VPLVGLRLLRKGYVLLHSASFIYNGKGILVTGWQKGGKTEMLLAFMAAGARYISDEWTIVGGEVPRLYGLQGTLKMWDWHLRSLPRYLARIPRSSRLRLRLVALYRRFISLPGFARLRGTPLKVLHELSREAGSPLGLVTISPEALFTGKVWTGPAPLDRVFLAVLGQGNETRVCPIDHTEVAERIVGSLEYERRSLLQAYHQFNFAFPGRPNKLIENARDRERDVLLTALNGKPAYEIRHPYPVSLAELYSAAVSTCL